MIKLAEFDGLKYTYSGIEDNMHLVVVSDSYNREARIFIEDCSVLSSNLSGSDLGKARTEIRDFKPEFLEYIEECYH